MEMYIPPKRRLTRRIARHWTSQCDLLTLAGVRTPDPAPASLHEVTDSVSSAYRGNYSHVQGLQVCILLTGVMWLLNYAAVVTGVHH